MRYLDANPSLVPDAVITWTTTAALIAFGVIFFDDSVIMGRTILALGVLSAANEALKLRGGHRRVRLGLALAYAALVLAGFLFPPAAP